MEKQAIPQRPKDNNKRLPVSENMHEIVITKKTQKERSRWNGSKEFEDIISLIYIYIY